MSDFSKDGFHKATNASAQIHINAFMERDTASALKNMRAALASDLPDTPQP